MSFYLITHSSENESETSSYDSEHAHENDVEIDSYYEGLCNPLGNNRTPSGNSFEDNEQEIQNSDKIDAMKLFINDICIRDTDYCRY